MTKIHLTLNGEVISTIETSLPPEEAKAVAEQKINQMREDVQKSFVELLCFGRSETPIYNWDLPQ